MTDEIKITVPTIGMNRLKISDSENFPPLSGFAQKLAKNWQKTVTFCAAQ